MTALTNQVKSQDAGVQVNILNEYYGNPLILRLKGVKPTVGELWLQRVVRTGRNSDRFRERPD